MRNIKTYKLFEKKITKVKYDIPEIGDIYLGKDIRPEFLERYPTWETYKTYTDMTWNEYQSNKNDLSLKWYTDGIFIVVNKLDNNDKFFTIITHEGKDPGGASMRYGMFNKITKPEDYLPYHPQIIFDLEKEINDPVSGLRNYGYLIDIWSKRFDMDLIRDSDELGLL